MILRPFQGKSPKIDPSAWIAEDAVIIGCEHYLDLAEIYRKG